MPSQPTWPESSGPRILTLVGNDLTIDVRARKTASSLARAGFSVISVGIDTVGNAPTMSDLDGALLYRVIPSNDPRISARPIRVSRNELRDTFRYRSELLRSRLQILRRDLLPNPRTKPGNPFGPSDAQDRFAQIGSHVGETNLDDTNRGGLDTGWSTRGPYTRVSRKLRTIALRGRYQFHFLIYKWLARPRKTSMRSGRWRRDLPEMHRYELALGPLVDMLQPDLIHVHDIFHIGVAVRAKMRAAARGRRVRVLYDAHEFVAGLPIDARKRSAYVDLEREYIHDVDAVITVSPGLVALLVSTYGLSAELVMNAPDDSTAQTVASIREVARIPTGIKLLVYVGGIAPHRGAESLVEAMKHLPEDTNLVFVSATTSEYVMGLLALAEELDVDGRVHLVPYVAPEAVVSYIQSADVSVIPLSRDVPNYEVALPNKLFQSIHAGVPVAVSDNPDMKEFVEKWGIGEVFDGSHTDNIATAVRTILNNPKPYRAALASSELLEKTSWAHQAEVLVSLYRDLGISVGSAP